MLIVELFSKNMGRGTIWVEKRWSSEIVSTFNFVISNSTDKTLFLNDFEIMTLIGEVIPNTGKVLTRQILCTRSKKT
jgi:hypothetical protein